MRAKYLASIAAVSLIAMGGAAAAQSAQPLSLNGSPTVQRAGAATSGESDLRRRGAAFYVVGAVILGLIIWGIIELTNNDHDMPNSP